MAFASRHLRSSKVQIIIFWHCIMYHALIRTHHITSRKKVATLKAAAKKHGCAALLRSGGIPGIMYVRGDERGVKEWVDVVHVGLILFETFTLVPCCWRVSRWVLLPLCARLAIFSGQRDLFLCGKKRTYSVLEWSQIPPTYFDFLILIFVLAVGPSLQGLPSSRCPRTHRIYSSCRELNH